MQHLAAFYGSIDPDGALTPIPAVQDQAITTQGNDVRIPDALPNLIGEIALTAEINLVAARVVSPSLRRILEMAVEPIVGAIVFGSPPEAIMHPLNPTPLDADESINFEINSNPAAVGVHYGLIWLSDGPMAPVGGQMYSVRATAAITLAAGVWVNGNLAFGQTLPAGRYQVVGLRARGTNLVAARLVFPGGTFRPGVPAVNVIGDLDAHWFRYGQMGVMGEFEHTTPPTLDALGVTDTVQNCVLDLVKIS